jgi:hypothetical protein
MENIFRNPIHQQIAREKQINKGQNNVLTGYPGFDSLLIRKNPNYLVWKSNELKKSYLGSTSLYERTQSSV